MTDMPLTRMRKTTSTARRAIAAAGAALALVAGGGCGDQPASLHGATREPAPNVGHVRLPDSVEGTGQRLFAMKAGHGRLLLVYFGYTSCPDVCPTTLSDIAVALRRLAPEQRRRVVLAFVTVDPRRDSATGLARYLASFFPNNETHALRTEQASQLNRAERAFGATHEVGKPGRDGEYEVAHSAFTYVVDDRGRVLLEWPFGTLAGDIAADLRVLLTRTQTGNAGSTIEIENEGASK